MNRRFRFLVIACAVSSVLSLSAVLTQDTQKSIGNQYGIPESFFTPIRYTSQSITNFLTGPFNHPKYPQDFLARNFSHVNQIVSLASQNKHPRHFIKKGLNLFFLKLHNIVINPYAFCSFIEQLITNVEEHMREDSIRERTLEAFKQTVGAFLVDHFEQLRYDPDETLHELALQLYDLAHPGDNEDITIRELQHALHYFLSQGLRLVVWSPDDQEYTWESLMTIASRLEQCAQYNLIDSEMLDDLYWALLNRYTVFLSIAGAELDPKVYDIACKDMRQDAQAFWNSEERELYITTKFDHLREALMRAEASAHLHAEGYVQ